jgi:hypothetical protein
MCLKRIVKRENTTEDENVSNMSSDNERLTKEMFSIPSSARSRDLVSLCVCIIWIYMVKCGRLEEKPWDTSKVFREKLWIFDNFSFFQRQTTVKVLSLNGKVFSLRHEDSSQVIINFEGKHFDALMSLFIILIINVNDISRQLYRVKQ